MIRVLTSVERDESTIVKKDFLRGLYYRVPQSKGEFLVIYYKCKEVL